MLDLGASINVMSTLVYKSLHLGDLKPTGVVIHLTNISVVLQLGVIENVLVRVNNMIFPANFYVFGYEE